MIDLIEILASGVLINIAVANGFPNIYYDFSFALFILLMLYFIIRGLN